MAISVLCAWQNKLSKVVREMMQFGLHESWGDEKDDTIVAELMPSPVT